MSETARYTPSVVHLVSSVAGRWSTRARFHSTSRVRFPSVTRWAVRLLPMALAMGIGAQPATAADLYWDANGSSVGSGGTGNWNTTSALWSQSNNDVAGPYQAWINNALTPGNAIFGITAPGTTTTVGTITLTEGITAQNLTFQTVHNWIVSGNTLTLAGTTPTISTPGNATINSIIAGTSGLVKTGGATLTLTGANTFSGGITLSGGALTADDNAALGDLSNNIAVTANSTFVISSGTTARTVSIDSGVTLIVAGGAGSAFLTGAGNVNVAANNNLTNNASTYTGTTRFNGCNGVCSSTFTSIGNLGEASALGAPITVANGTITFGQASQYTDSLIYTGDGDSSNRNWIISTNNSAIIRNRGTGTLTLTGDVASSGGGTVSFSAELADYEVLGVLSGGNYSFGGSAGRSVTLGSANTFTGQASVAGVSVYAPVLANSGVDSSLGAGSIINLGNAGTLSYTGSGASTDRTWNASGATTLANDGTGALTLVGPVTLASNSTLTLGGTLAGTNTISGIISGSGNLANAGSGTWVLSGANTRSGTITVNSGTLQAGSASAFGTTTGITVNGGTLDLNSFALTTPTLAGTGGTLALGTADLTVNGTTNSSYAGSISGDGGLIKSGTNTLTLTGANTYIGDTTLNGGTLKLDFSTAGGPTDNIVSASSTLNISGSTTFNVTGAAGETNTQTLTGLNVTGGSNTISAISGAGGTLTLDLGTINQSGGLANFILPTMGNIATDNPDGPLGGWATVNGTDYAEVVGGFITAFTAYTNKDDASTWLDGEFLSDTAGAANSPYFGTVSGSKQLGGLKYTAAGNSTITIGAGQSLGVDGTIIVAPSVGTASQTINGAGSLTGGAGGSPLGVIVNSTGVGVFVISSTIVDNGGATGFSKGGGGTLNLTGANTYTGATTLSGGTLWIGSIANGGAASTIGASSNASSNLVLESGRLYYSGNTATTDRGFTLVNGGGSRTIEIANAPANLTFTGLVTSPDDAGLTKAGLGTLTLANDANDYTGATTINAGVLSVDTLADGGNPSGIGAATSASTNLVLAGGTLQYTGATASSNRGFTLGTGSGHIDVNIGGTTLTIGGPAVGTGSLTKDGAGTLVLSGTNTYTGGNRVTAGTLRAGSTQAFGGQANGTGAGPMTVDAGATLDLAGFNNYVGGLNGAGTVLLGAGTLTTNTNGTFTGKISGTGGLTHIGGFQTLTGCNSDYTGPTTLNFATIVVDCLADGGSPSSIGASSSASPNFTMQVGTLRYTGPTVSTNRGITLASDGAIEVTDPAATLTISGTITGGGRLVKRSSGTLVLSGANNYTGGTLIQGGTVRAATTNALGTGGVHFTDDTGVMLDLDGFNTTVNYIHIGGALGGNVILDGATLTLSDGSGANYAAAITGAGNIVKNGGGLQTFSGCSSSYSGTTTINGGVLAVACLTNGGSNSSIGTSAVDPTNLVLNGGSLRYVGTGGSTNRQFTLGTTAGSTLDSSGTGAIAFTSTAAITLSGTNTARTLTLRGTNTGNNTLAAQITDNGTGKTALVKTDAGTWILTNPNSTYTGITTVSGGVLAVDKLVNGGLPSSIGASPSAAANLVIGSGSTLRYTGTGDTTNRLLTLSTGTTFIEASGSGPIVFTDTGTVTLQTNNQPRTIALGGTNTGLNTFAGAIGNAGTGVTTLAKNDSGTWALTGNNTYTGNTVINNGNLMIGTGGTTGNVGTGNVIVDSATSTLSMNRSDTFTFAGTLFGPGTLAQIGSGTTVLTSATSSIGATRVTAGTLQVNGGLTTATVAMTGTSTLTVNGMLGAAGSNPLAFTGDTGSATVNINNGGLLRANGTLGGGSDVVTLSGTLETGSAALNLGDGNDTLTLNDTGVFTGAGFNAGNGTDTLHVNNAVARTLTAATVPGFEALDKTLGGTLTLTGAHDFSAGTTIGAGEVQLGDGVTAGSINGNVLNNGELTFNNPSAYTFAHIASGSGTVNQIGAGITTLTGANSYAGPTSIQAGGLIINGNQSGATGLTSVSGGALLGGSGIIGGDVIIADNGVIAPGNSPGTLTINGDLTLNDASILQFEFGLSDTVGGSFNDLLDVEGDLVLDGTLNVTLSSGGTFGPGLYRVINYGGSFTDHGLLLGTMPPSSNVVLQISVPNQVNLINAAGLTLNYWDGDAGPTNDGIIQGGNGTWQSGGESWTDDVGGINAPYTDGEFAIFMGTGGTVTVDTSGGAINVSGMQFAVNGYTVGGDDITLVGSSAIVRVGDGSMAGASMSATINSVLTGTAQLEKSDLGTLVLTATNTYTGGTAINGGVLQVSSDGNLGDASSALGFDGGTLRNTSAFASARAVTLNALGGTLDTAADLDLTGTIDGDGALTKTGSGVLTLAGTNTYEGGTVINGGVVSVSSNANLGDASGSISFDGGTLRNTSAFGAARNVTLNASGGTFDTLADLDLSGLISGAGALTKTGDGILTLSADHTYTGGTTITAGTVQLGNGGASGAIIGDVLDNGALIFNRSDTYTFAGLISGTGTVEQVGAGTTILSANNPYAGQTFVREGGLLINGDQSGATGLTTVEDGGTIGGLGIIGGNVVIADNGALAPGAIGEVPGTLTINGNLSLGASSLNYNFGEADVVGGAFNDLAVVHGDLALAGTLNVTVSAGGSFEPGLYRIINYDGALSDSGLALGTMPVGDFEVQTSVANQVNLVNQDIVLSFWDGNAGPKGDNLIQGGDGIWQLDGSLDNWTDVNGGINGNYAQNTFAIFTGAPGTVTVDNGNGAVGASGMQFAVDGYTITGAPLTLVGPQSIIRVGDGTDLGAAYTATITAELTGSTQLVKSDLGTLVLSGTNTYTGGTAIYGGTLRISSDANLGAAAGGLVFSGGALNTTATFSSPRAITLDGQATFVTDADTTFTLGGAIAGAGNFIKNGLGTLVLTGDAAHTGGTTVSEGALQVGNGGTTGSLAGNVLVSGTLAFNRSDTLGFAGVISGTGFVRQIGSGTTDLTGDSSGFAGTALVEAGTLAVNGALCGQVNVLTGARLQGTGVLCDTANAGTIAPGNSSIGTLTVDGEYVGNSGVLEIESVLGNDSSPTDRLVVTGSTSGSTTVHVLNLGGQGAPTIEGIKIIDVAGASNGTFTLDADYVLNGTPVVVAGAYGYALYKNGVSTPTDGDWYLRSSLTNPPSDPDPTDPPGPGPGPDPDPDDDGDDDGNVSPLYQAGVPVYEAYAQALQSFNAINTFKQRTGNRVWGEGAVRDEGFWLRLDALKGRFDPERSTANVRSNLETWKIQIGADARLFERPNGSVIGSLFAQYGTLNSDIDSRHGIGKISSDGFGVGAALTWHGTQGGYIDGLAQATWLKSDLDSKAAGNLIDEDNHANGYGLSLEAGHALPISANLSLTPQAQLTYTSVRFDDFVDTFGAAISLADSDLLQGRLGVSLDHSRQWMDADGRSAQRRLYGLANLFYAFDGENTALVSGTAFRSQEDRLWGGLGLGTAYNFGGGRHTLFLEGSANTSLNQFGDSYTFNANLGWRMTW